LLLVAATASVVIATVTGVYYWDAIVLGALAMLLWFKKLATFKGLLMLLKKLPLLLLLGVKRLVIKVTSHFLLFTANIRFRWLQHSLRYLRARARLVKMQLNYQWGGLSRLEKILATIAALPLAVVLSSILLVFIMPKAMFTFLLAKLKEYSSAVVLKQAAELGVEGKLVTAEKKIKEEIQKKMKKTKYQEQVKVEKGRDEG